MVKIEFTIDNDKQVLLRVLQHLKHGTVRGYIDYLNADHDWHKILLDLDTLQLGSYNRMIPPPPEVSKKHGFGPNTVAITIERLGKHDE